MKFSPLPCYLVSLKVPIHVRVWLGSGSNESNSSVCRVSRAGEIYINIYITYIRAWLPSQAPRGGLASQTRKCMGTFTPKYSTQHPILKHPQPTLLPNVRFTTTKINRPVMFRELLAVDWRGLYKARMCTVWAKMRAIGNVSATANSDYNLRLSLSVCLSVRMEQLCSHWTDLHEIWYMITYEYLEKKLNFHYNVTSSAGTFVTVCRWIMKNGSHKIGIEKTDFIFDNFFPEIVLCIRWYEKNMVAWQATVIYNTAHELLYSAFLRLQTHTQIM
jgi:hypothetical protein